MPTAIIADDEPHMRDMLREHLQALWPELQILGESEDGPSALLQIENLRPDLAFLDIRMPGLTGLQVAREMTVPSRVVFVTAYDNHAIEAFEMHAVDYVLKPVSAGRLASVISHLRKPADLSRATPDQLRDALERLGVPGPAAPTPHTVEWLNVEVGQKVHMVHIDDVIYFEADSKMTRVVSADVDGCIRTSLTGLLKQLDSRTFLQTHRSTVVNRRFIRTVHKKDDKMDIELRGRTERIQVSEPNQKHFKAM